MARGNGNNNRGRGRGRGGRGAPPFRGSPGRGAFSPGGRGGRGGRPVYRDLDVIDVDIQRYVDEVPGDAYNAPRARGRGFGRGRGRGRGRGTPINLQVFNNNGSRTPPPPRHEGGSETATPASRSNGRGPSRGLGASYNGNMPLSKLLALDRPYLRPINFVPAQATPVLFQREEELLEVHEFTEPEDHVPTAEQVSRVFSHQQPAPPPQDSFFQNPEVDFLAEGDSEDIMTVDFGSLGQLMDNNATSHKESKLHPRSNQPETEPQPMAIEADTNSVNTVDFGNIDQLLEKDFVAEPAPGPANAVEPAIPVLGPGLNIFDAIKDALAQKEPESTVPSPSVKIQSPPRVPEQQLVEEQTLVVSDEVHIQIDEAIADEAEIQQEESPLFFIDPNPTLPTPIQENIVYDTAPGDAQPLGADTTEDDDEVIVYVAPHPRSGHPTPSIPTAALGSDSPRYPASVPLPASGRGTPITGTPTLPRMKARAPPLVPDPVGPVASSSTAPVPPQPFAGMSFSFDAISRAAEVNREQAASPRARRLTKRDRQARTGQWNEKKRSAFGGYGAMLEERHLHDDDDRKRREGSDIDWGDSDEVGAEIDRVSSSLGGMEIDPDLDPRAMQSFANSMSVKGMEHIRIDDIEDTEKLRLEDEDDDESSSGSESGDSELDEALDAEEQLLVGEGLASDSDSDEDDEDDDATPTRNFQARLTRIRQNAVAKGKMRESAFSGAQASPGGLFAAREAKLPYKGKSRAVDSDSDSDSDDFNGDFTWADDDEEYLKDIQELLDENEDILSDRKQRKLMFKAVHNGDFSVTPAKKKRDYSKDLPEELRAQWESDRAKKAENKRRRAAARLEAAADPFVSHKGGKKGRKAMLRASRLAAEADIEAPRNAGPNLAMLVDQMRAFLANMNLTVPMALPPMDKVARAKVHEIADSFGLKSISKGKGTARYTTIIKTSRSGKFINERKITRILKSGGNWGFTRPENPGYGGGSGGGKGKGSAAPKHREGDEVGKAAPKIGESNIGFQMLANMGWAEGDRIGVTGGLEVPLTAIIKNTKLGLGATR